MRIQVIVDDPHGLDPADWDLSGALTAADVIAHMRRSARTVEEAVEEFALLHNPRILVTVTTGGSLSTAEWAS
jgi:hypothetical protein